MTVLFVGHGAPTLAFDKKKGAEIAAMRPALGDVRAAIVVSAHWESDVPTTGTIATRPLLYDFQGFPEPLYHVGYPAPGAPDLAVQVRDRIALANIPVEQAPGRAWDHGVWVPLLHLFPKHDVPILQLSLTDSPAQLFAIGRALASLTREGVCLIASGNLVHNLRRIDFHDREPPPGWAIEYDAWIAEQLASRNWDAILDYERTSPNLALAHPSREHFLPVLVAAGAAAQLDLAAPTFPVTGFEFATIGRRCALWV